MREINQLALDLGTRHTRIAIPGEGVVLDEVTALWIDKKTGDVKAGNEAAGADTILICHSIVADKAMVAKMITCFFEKLSDRFIIKDPIIVVNIISSITNTAKEALIDCLMEAGAKEVIPIERSFAVALGAGMNFENDKYFVFIDIGHSTTDILIRSVAAEFILSVAITLNLGANEYIKSRRKFYENKLHLRFNDNINNINENDQENYKKVFIEKERTIRVKDRPNVLRFVRSIKKITHREYRRAMDAGLDKLFVGCKNELDKLIHGKDYSDGKFILTGGGANYELLGKKLSREYGMEAIKAENPSNCVILGLLKVFDIPELIKDIRQNIRKEPRIENVKYYIVTVGDGGE
jgi:rod shape-determining protein MreB